MACGSMPLKPVYPLSYNRAGGGLRPLDPRRPRGKQLPDSGERKSPQRRGLVQARVSARELAAWRSKAAAAGVSSSALLRQAMARTGAWTPSASEVERARRREVERARTRELVRIGNNLNQIARWANRHKSAADAGEVSLRLAAIELALRGLTPPAG